MRIIFWGTPDYVIPFLEYIWKKFNLVAVVTKSDKPAGRGLEIHPQPVANFAKNNLKNILLFQPEKLKDNNEFKEKLKNLAPELCVVVSYGKIIPKDLLSIPKIGFLNLHFSYLPDYRGASPVRWVLINGEKETGITTFWIDEGMDTGPIFMQNKINISDDDNYDSLLSKMVSKGLEILDITLRKIEKNEIIKIPQSHLEGKLAPILKKENFRINWESTAQEIHNFVRGSSLHPGAFCFFRDKRIKILKTKLTQYVSSQSAGSIEIINKNLFVNTSDRLLQIELLQFEGRNIIKGLDFVNGVDIQKSDKFI